MPIGAAELTLAYVSAFLDRDGAWWSRRIAPGFVRHNPNVDFAVKGLSGIRRLAAELHGGFPEIGYPTQ